MNLQEVICVRISLAFSALRNSLVGLATVALVIARSGRISACGGVVRAHRVLSDSPSCMSDTRTYGFSFTVPEPSTWAMILLGFVGLGYAARGGPATI